MAATRVLEFALEIGITDAVMEGESLLVTQALVAHTNSLAPLGHLITDAMFLSNNFNELHYFHVKREGNKDVHSLARHAKHIVDFVVWMETVHLPSFSVFQANLALIQ